MSFGVLPPMAGTWVQGWTLVALAGLSVVAGALIAPVLPRMAAVFADAPRFQPPHPA